MRYLIVLVALAMAYGVYGFDWRWWVCVFFSLIVLGGLAHDDLNMDRRK